jgi:hypothetical protein
LRTRTWWSARTLRIQAADEIRERMGEPGCVSVAGAELFIYPDGEAPVLRAAQIAVEVAASHHLETEISVERRLLPGDRWVDATSASMPSGSRLAEFLHQHLMSRESQRSAMTGIAEWTVRVRMTSRESARALAESLRGEGIPVTRREHVLLVAARNEDEARMRIRQIGQIGSADISMERAERHARPRRFIILRAYSPRPMT